MFTYVIIIVLNFEGRFFMTFEEKLRYLDKNYPEVYEVLCITVPNLVENPPSPSLKDLEQYNFWIDSIDGDEALALYHYID